MGDNVMKKVGRPSKYTPELGDKVLKHMSEGFSLTASAGMIGVGKVTVYRWAEEHEEFRDALNLGRAARLAFLEKLHFSGTLPPATTIFALKNADTDEWREKIEHGGNVGLTVTISSDDAEVL